MPALSTVEKSVIPVIDLFAGPGGLGDGFAALGRAEGQQRFAPVLSIENAPRAHATLLLRSFFRQFPHGAAPDAYYDLLRGRTTMERLFAEYPAQARQAQREAQLATLGDASRTQVDEGVAAAVGDSPCWVLLGGPPCQAYSVVGRSRNRGNAEYRPENDSRHYLYQEYRKIIARYAPPVFVMENVKGLLSAQVSDESIVHRILTELADPSDGGGGHRYRIHSLTSSRPFGDEGFTPSDLVVRAERYGVPQSRHRVILLGVRDDLDAQAPPVLQERHPIPVAAVLADLPKVRSGLSQQQDDGRRWVASLREFLTAEWLVAGRATLPPSVLREVMSVLDQLVVPAADRGGEFVYWEQAGQTEALREWFRDPRLGGVCNHTARSHMSGDLHRYLFAACFAKVTGTSPKMADLPAGLLPAHRNAGLAARGGPFDDRFRVQVATQPSATVVSHIAKDGHYYIHYDPAQCRSLTVREVARLQTFPDNYFFCGPRTAQYVQVGNAVPPYLALQIARIVLTVLEEAGLVG